LGPIGPLAESDLHTTYKGRPYDHLVLYDVIATNGPASVSAMRLVVRCPPGAEVVETAVLTVPPDDGLLEGKVVVQARSTGSEVCVQIARLDPHDKLVLKMLINCSEPRDVSYDLRGADGVNVRKMRGSRFLRETDRLAWNLCLGLVAFLAAGIIPVFGSAFQVLVAVVMLPTLRKVFASLEHVRSRR
jgi:hypothetical protein